MEGNADACELLEEKVLSNDDEQSGESEDLEEKLDEPKPYKPIHAERHSKKELSLGYLASLNFPSLHASEIGPDKPWHAVNLDGPNLSHFLYHND